VAGTSTQQLDAAIAWYREGRRFGRTSEQLEKAKREPACAGGSA